MPTETAEVPAIDLTGCTYEDDSGRSRAQRHFDRTGERTSPWRVHPERETFECRALRDGQVVARCTVSAWGGQSVSSEWVAETAPAAPASTVALDAPVLVGNVVEHTGRPTRGPAALTTIEDVRRFVFAGDARFTLVSGVTGRRFTFRLQHKADTIVSFLSVLNGANNEADYVYLGTLFDGTREIPNTQRTRYEHGRKSRVGPDAPSAKAATWFMNKVLINPAAKELPAELEVWHEGKCGRCGRTLTVPESIANGIGPECARIMAGS